MDTKLMDTNRLRHLAGLEPLTEMYGPSSAAPSDEQQLISEVSGRIGQHLLKQVGGRENYDQLEAALEGFMQELYDNVQQALTDNAPR